MRNTELSAIIKDLESNHSKSACPYVVLVDKSKNETTDASIEVSYAGHINELLELYFCHTEVIINTLKKTRSEEDIKFLLSNAITILMLDAFFEDEFTNTEKHSMTDIDEASFPELIY